MEGLQWACSLSTLTLGSNVYSFLALGLLAALSISDFSRLKYFRDICELHFPPGVIHAPKRVLSTTLLAQAWEEIRSDEEMEERDEETTDGTADEKEVMLWSECHLKFVLSLVTYTLEGNTFGLETLRCQALHILQRRDPSTYKHKSPLIQGQCEAAKEMWGGRNAVRGRGAAFSSSGKTWSVMHNFIFYFPMCNYQMYIISHTCDLVAYVCQRSSTYLY